MWSLIPSRSERRARPIRPSRMLFFSLIGAFCLAVLPHVSQIPVWVAALAAIGVTVRSISEVRRWRLPGPTLCGMLALVAFAAIYVQFGTIFGRDAGTALMIALLTIKFFELRSARDIALIIFCCFFVIMSSLLYSQDLELFIYCLVMMWAFTALLLRTSMGDQPENRPGRLLGTSGLIFLQAFPLTLFLFFFFPRYHGVLRIGADESSVGLTDKVEPGSISRLADDESTAMTASITAPGLITPENLYWRGIVLWNYRDGVWTPGTPSAHLLSPTEALPRPEPGVALQQQQITIYPHFRRWLFALDYPVGLAEPINSAGGWSQALNGGVLELRNGSAVIGDKQRYMVTSAPILASQNLSPELLQAALQLPDQPGDEIDPGVKALAAKLQAGTHNESEFIGAVLHYFRHNHFVYSTSGGARGKNVLGDFLLRDHVGFCEHFASSFAVLMRLQHVPARVVVGYVGAQYNPYKNLYIVKQSNAHSWDEVWMSETKTWRRVDPTAILSAAETAPGLAGDTNTPSGLSIELAGHPFTLISGQYLPSWASRSILETQLRRQELEADWNDWIFSYDPKMQNGLASTLGIHQLQRTFVGLLCLVAVGFCGAVLALAMRRRVKVPPVEKFYDDFCLAMARRGAPRATWEAPSAYTERLVETFPDERAVISEAGDLVVSARYAANTAPVAPAKMQALLSTLSTSRVPVARRER